MSTRVTDYTVPVANVAACADVERPELREAEGIAHYRVTFVDGEPQTVTCISDDAEGDAAE